MRYFIGCVALLFAYAGCTSTETVQQEETGQPEPVATSPSSPTWYKAGVHSSSDSLAVYGYSLASDTDSSRAVEISAQNAREYLRFEIDRTVENVRQELVDSESSQGYASTSFIIQLRNTVSSLPVQAAELIRSHDVSDSGVHYSYTQASFTHSDFFDLFENRFEDAQFLEALGNYSR